MACDASCTEGCTSGAVCTACHPSCGTCTAGETGIEECLSCRCGSVKVNPGATKSACCCLAGYVERSNFCQPICSDYGCSICNDVDNHSCEVCDLAHRLSSNEDGTCQFCVDTPWLLFSESCAPRNPHKPMSHCTCEINQFYDNRLEICRSMSDNCDNDCVANSSTPACCSTCDTSNWQLDTMSF